MGKKPSKQEENANYLQAWREHRRLTQEQLGEKVGTTGAVISLLESGDRALSPKWLRRIAPVLGISIGWLLEHHPDRLPTDILDMWADVPEERRQHAKDVLSTFTRTGTTG